jgi:hypothetical protein
MSTLLAFTLVLLGNSFENGGLSGRSFGNDGSRAVHDTGPATIGNPWLLSVRLDLPGAEEESAGTELPSALTLLVLSLSSVTAPNRYGELLQFPLWFTPVFPLPPKDTLELRVPIPDSPEFRGIVLFSQAMVLETERGKIGDPPGIFPTGLHYSNVRESEIR